MMMKKLVLLFAILTAVLAAPVAIGASSQVFAVDVFPVCNGKASSTDVCQNVNNHGTAGDNPIIGVLKVAIGILSIIVGIAAVIMIIVAGLSFITANGDAQAVARARSSIIYALIGVVIVAFSQAIVKFILNKL